MDICRIVANNINKLMRASSTVGTSQKLADRAGVGFGTVQRARRSEGNVTIEKLHRIATALGVTVADLVTPDAKCQDVGACNESGREKAWPFPLCNQHAYEALSAEDKAWAQGRFDGIVEQAAQRSTARGRR